jgi:DNA-binding MarR family transcriptional regulator
LQLKAQEKMEMQPITLSEETFQQVIDLFWESIPPAWGRIRSNLRTIAAEQFDITVEQFHILRHIRKGLHSASELATEKRISRPAISQAIDLLVAKGLITRHQDASDRRFVTLDLTPDGNNLLNTIFAENRGWMKDRLAALNPEEIDILMQAFGLLKSSFTESLN